MAIGKRGVVFTLIAIIVSALLISTYATEQVSKVSSVDLQSESTRISLLNAFFTTVTQHTEQSLTTAGYFTLRRMSEKIHNESGFTANENVTVQSCLVDNSIDILGSAYECLNLSHQVNTSLEALAKLAKTELAITLDYYVLDAWVTEDRPMEVIFWVNLSFNISDAFASWIVPGYVVSARVDATGIRDPFYEFMNATGNTTERRNFSLTGFRPSQFNGTVFDMFYYNQSYILWEGASPSVLQRFRGSTGPSSCCGVESVMLRSELTFPNSNLEYGNFSMVDHHYIQHINGSLSKFDCESNQIKKLKRGTDYLAFNWFSFENPYNLSGSTDHDLNDCAWS